MILNQFKIISSSKWQFFYVFFLEGVGGGVKFIC